MPRIKHMAKRGKEKVGEGSSAQPEESPSQRQRTGGADDRGPKPVWTGGLLSDIDPSWQAELWMDKMNKLNTKHEGYICERVIVREHFQPFGIPESFDRLGWEAVMEFPEMRKPELYMEPIDEWMASLKVERGGDYPKSMRLVGYVGKKKVVMSSDTLKHVAKFDTKGSNYYTYPAFEEIFDNPRGTPNWNTMVQKLFNPGAGSGLWRQDLKIEAKFMLIFVQQNVMPRRGDKVKVRDPEVIVLHSLLYGTPRISFSHLAMLNIWESRNSHERKIVAHCRLIQALFRWHGLLAPSYGWDKSLKRDTTFELAKLKKYQWKYFESERYHRVLDENTRRIWDVLKENARPLHPGEPDTFNSENMMGDIQMPDAPTHADDDNEPIASVLRRRRRGGSSSQQRPQQQQPQWQNRGAPWGSLDEEMDRIVTAARPSDWSHWDSFQRMSFDHQTQLAEMQRRDAQMAYERNEHWNRLHAYNFQREINHNFDDAQMRRMHDEWHRGEQVVQHPPVIDYTSLDPYDGSVRYPMPQTHHSEWLNPYPDQQQQGDGTPSVFNFSEIEETMNSIFGPQQPRYF